MRENYSIEGRQRGKSGRKQIAENFEINVRDKE